MYKYTCKEYGSEFEYKDKVRIYCSRKCMLEANRSVERQCKNCNSTFYIIKSKADSGKGVYCSRKCFIDYKNKQSKVYEYICLICNKEFKSKKIGRKYCNPKCQAIGHSLKTKKSNEQYINECNIIHDNFYKYTLTKYNGTDNLITIICPYHGQFDQLAGHHHAGHGCRECGLQKLANLFKKSNAKFISDAIEVHGYLYGYDLVEYVNWKTEVTIKCNRCGNIFDQIPMHHLRGHGCLKCNSSHGESQIINFLNTNHITYIYQKRYNDCRGVGNNRLSYDFYIPSHNLLIEFDGRQHYESAYIGGFKTTEEQFLKTKEHDHRKDEYAKNNNIKLLRIPYWDMKKISEILTENLKIEIK